MGGKMTVIKTPAPDAPAEEWGRLAVSILGWRFPDRRSCPLRYLGWDDADARPIPDPDHWVWEGWLWRLAGMPEVMVERGGERVRVWGSRLGCTRLGATGPTLGRALIAYVAAIGKWPGGGE